MATNAVDCAGATVDTADGELFVLRQPISETNAITVAAVRTGDDVVDIQFTYKLDLKSLGRMEWTLRNPMKGGVILVAKPGFPRAKVRRSPPNSAKVLPVR